MLVCFDSYSDVNVFAYSILCIKCIVLVMPSPMIAIIKPDSGWIGPVSARPCHIEPVSARPAQLSLTVLAYVWLAIKDVADWKDGRSIASGYDTVLSFI